MSKPQDILEAQTWEPKGCLLNSLTKSVTGSVPTLPIEVSPSLIELVIVLIATNQNFPPQWEPEQTLMLR